MRKNTNQLRTLLLVAVVVTSVFASTATFAGTAVADTGTVTAPAEDVEVGTDANFTVEDTDNPNPAKIVYFSDSDGTINEAETKTGDGTNKSFTVGRSIVDSDLDGNLDDEVTVTNTSDGSTYNVSSIDPIDGNVTVENAPNSSTEIEIAYTTAPEAQNIDLSGDGTVTATIGTAKSNANTDDGILKVAAGDTLTAAYWDASAGVYRSATASVTAANTAPTANDDTTTVTKGESVTIPVLDNDEDDGSLNTSSVTVVSEPSEGETTVHSNGSITYTHTADSEANDSFTYEVADDQGEVSNTANVDVTVEVANTAPTANDDTTTVNKGETVTVPVLDNDVDDGTFDNSSLIVVSGPSEGETTVNSDGTITYTHTADRVADDSFKYKVEDDQGVESNIATVDVTVETAVPDNTAPKYLASAHYDEDEGDGDTEIELSFSEPVENLGDSEIYINGDPKGTLSGYAASIDHTGGRYVATLDGNQVNTGDIKIRLADDITDTSDSENRLSNPGNKSVVVAPVTVSEAERNLNVYIGTKIAVVGDSPNTPVEIVNGDYQAGSTGDNSHVYIFDTANEDTDDYDITIGSGADEVEVEVILRNLALDIDIDDRNVTEDETIEGMVSSKDGNRPVTLELLDDDGDVVKGSTITGRFDGQAEYEFSLDASSLDLDPGEYNLRVTDDQSGVQEESRDITVTEAGIGVAEIPGDRTFYEDRGDVAKIAIDIRNTDTATLAIGNSDKGFRSNVTVKDGNEDGRVELLFNTYAVTGLEGELSDSERDAVYSTNNSEDSVTDADVDEQNSVSSLLEGASYPLEVRAGESSDMSDSQGVGQLILQERETSWIQSWTAPSQRNYDTADEIHEAITTNNLTKSNKVAFGDLAVHRIKASGIEGALKTKADDVEDAFFELSDDGDISFTVEQADPGPNREPYQFVLDGSHSDVVADGENDTYYVIVDTDEVETTERSVEPEHSLTANFTVFGDTGLADEEDQTVKAKYELVEAEFGVEEPLNVSATADEVIGGETNLAPGTQIDILIRDSGDTRPPFVKTGTAYVSEDGTFESTVDFSEQSVNDTFDAFIDGGPAGEVTIEGNVVDDGETPTPTDTPITSTSTTTTDTSTDTPTPTKTATPTDTPTPTETLQPVDTPGFGIPIAVVAFLAAALLVSRRE
ncbi:hypothetical protein C499_13670 [Halogeometricum borinquense DSM 11551]|uniref:DUF7827 domain-containing protein n=1 Tax=Halogeometricum borinquense (strain ATCC 700274 / DSM 11551 / JCM 10706 / KCTC 4070 / PR3) TaxID=469382 RepID=E4NU72_HALBP|nr:hypothetical protein Hbor_30550 [Halogeometricum borinquense DSM 11551]ELY25537.1 hypothetical protein C499_13670 [Halogeometricum borinquense DSM 11551]